MRRLVLSLITLVPFISLAQPRPLHLQEAMDYAVKNNMVARNARLDIQIQEARNAEITGLSLPQINGEAKYTQFTDLPAQFFPGRFAEAFTGKPVKNADVYQPVRMSPVYGTSANLTGSQLLFDGSVLVALRARNTVLKLTEQSARFTEEEIRYNVQKAYHAVAISQHQFVIFRASLANARGILNDLIALRNAGFAEKIEVDRVQVQVNNLVTDSIRVNSLLDLSERALKFAMGMDLNEQLVLVDTVIETNVAFAEAMLNDEVNYLNRTDYNLLLTQLQLNKYDLKRHRSSYLPSLALFGSAGYNYAADNFTHLYQNEYVFSSLWGVTLNVPVFDGFQRRNRVVQAKLNVLKTENNIENMELGIDFQAGQARTTLKNSLMAMDNQRRNMELGASVLDLARKKYKAGVGSNIEVTQAQTELLQSQTNYFLALLEVFNAHADLKKALGEFK
ncbi:TolC family protein [Polluticoccus soli]|uniref:TolC family protein n=1 Tax=Polluticoccus soli TaxID=3034150 RepID=UPI0023E27678|nr:TolC family protein [Flavipsychrobacter sp. JY13-12]